MRQQQEREREGEMIKLGKDEIPELDMPSIPYVRIKILFGIFKTHLLLVEMQANYDPS